MRHPFDGIEAPTHSRSRRAWLKGLLAAFAGLFVWKRAESCSEKPPVVFVPDGGTVVRWEAGGRNDPEPFDPRPSTAVRGEEGASVGPGAPVNASTKGPDEEGGLRPRIDPNDLRGPRIVPAGKVRPIRIEVTTLAQGEEG